MNVFLEQILRIDNGVVAYNAKDDLVELAPEYFRDASIIDNCKGGYIYRRIGPGEDVGRRAPIDGSFVDYEGNGIEEKANGCSGNGGSAQNARALFDRHP